MNTHEQAGMLAAALQGQMLSDDEARSLAGFTDLSLLLETASQLRDTVHHNRISYSRKVFIPLTQLCRDVCHYCTFAHPPRRGQRAYLSPDEILAIARAGAEAGCHEALFTLGDKPELRYKVARQELAEMGYASTIAYLAAMAELVFKETGLLPHANPGVMTAEDITLLRRVTVSQGIMLESASERLSERGGPHYGSPDKRPAVRLETIRLAGELQVPFTSGILIGIGETRAERIESLLALRSLHQSYGHIQEIIIQNFRAKPDTRMAHAPEPDLDELLWTLAVARVLFGPTMNIQAPPNLSPGTYRQLIKAGLNDWGGVSPVTPDHVNPEAKWPHLQELEQETAAAGKFLLERLAIYPDYVLNASRWLDQSLIAATLQASDTDGFARTEQWSPGAEQPIPASYIQTFAQALNPDTTRVQPDISSLIAKATAGEDLTEQEIVRLFQARGDDFTAICQAANDLRKRVNGDVVTYVVNRNINYTNICYFRCQFCAFSKGKLSENLRGAPYDLGLDEVVRRAQEAWERGATEVCMQGGIHPEYTGETYLRMCRAIKAVLPDMHIHAFSPLEVWQGAQTLGLSVHDFLVQLKEAGLGTLPGTAAEILDDEVRATLCPDKIKTDEWLHVMEEAHKVGFRTTATIMYGHQEQPKYWARHLLRLKQLQARTGGFTEFVPLPFVHMEAPVYWKGRARKGPTFREAILMHAVARLVLYPLITSIQVSWVKMGREGVKICLQAGANDMGGTLMNESITRAAGGEFGQELPPEQMEEVISSLGRIPQQRTTLYRSVSDERRQASYNAPVLQPIVLTPSKRYVRNRA
ncbi:FO synthase [Reticulibacter mediterranei]|uniref:FO synthase n=2 Tax=Reticulibacter mediterranei TaxID=2778369 RepID=A0A8J3IEE5_9CHLR|nr:5-amino-6-(D-ribitylamino)uracil--L-tyrosine 4-hydroxyphenyl transferase CofH [Reticulibacter mediterranei]GHO92801.1 FO synthase [Reticulibacter mediterranei]